jgi:hypothetical protein
MVGSFVIKANVWGIISIRVSICLRKEEKFKVSRLNPKITRRANPLPCNILVTDCSKERRTPANEANAY